jgi:hypothetical protein
MDGNGKAKLYTITEAVKANLLPGLTEHRIRQMCKSGELKTYRAGVKYLFTEEALLQAVGINHAS